jgi:2-C-methyl-D-erythritol 4-phosphate cytidylyltransferase/2-C-methyl-D-erythritol 2,4-cyclodiphosphate synthase
MTGPLIAALVVAAGRGTRAGGAVPKAYRAVNGEPMLRASLRRLREHQEIGLVLAVIHPDDESLYRDAAGLLSLPAPAHGGGTRQASVRAGLEALQAARPEIVLVHDAARPFLTSGLVSRAIASVAATGAAIPVLPVNDTVKSVDDGGQVLTTLDRARLRTVQTPQAFRFDAILAAHRRAAASGHDNFPDDASLAEWAGMAVMTFPGDEQNVKLTTENDFVRSSVPADVRTGSGFDVHAFGEGDHVFLGGIRIAHKQALTGHSDADAALHALVDAILGALAEGDIGAHFPPTDPQWRGAASDRFLRFAADRVRARGGRIAHLDLTIICETPKIGPHRDAMRERIAGIAGISPDRVAVKATTSEGLGFTGRREGIAAMATATIRLPGGPGDAG